MKKKKFIPFWLTSKFRNTSGTERQIAEIDYYYTGREKELLIAETTFSGEDLRKKKIEIQFKYGDISDYEKRIQLANILSDKVERELALLVVDRDFQKIDVYTFDTKAIELKYSGLEKDLELVAIDFKHNKISDLEREKKIASLKKEPWVKIVSVDVDKENPGIGSVELDWNQDFIIMLCEHGYAAPTPEKTVDMWFDELCKNIALNAYDGIGDFNEQLDNAVETKPIRKQTKRKGVKS